MDARYRPAEDSVNSPLRSASVGEMPVGPKLRAKPLDHPFEIALVEPEIPPNTGAIARTAAATASRLHLIGKLGFRIDEQSVRRAGLDYWPLVDLATHKSFEAFLEGRDTSRFHFLTAGVGQSIYEADFQPGDTLVFGKESVGLDAAILARFEGQAVAIPTLGPVRSLNLATAVSITVYEALRQAGGLSKTFLASDAIGSGKVQT
ncbi:MAG: tRNA (cytidine/uridine-2'-O-)-methyltransferase [Polyangiales bacterium]|jgi:tRNA (cytidine/uridine-2'-O-)-methyltransferase